MTDNRTTELLPCPFCGGEAHMSASSDGYGVQCWNRRCIDMQMEEIPTEAEAIAAWNARPERGTLTTEQVREAIEKRFDFDVWVPKERWQAIADELNAGWAIDYDGESLFRDCEEIVRCQKPAKNEDVKPDRLGGLSGSQAYFPVEGESRLRK